MQTEPKREPAPTDDNGRDRRGRFVRGNKAGRGNPLPRKSPFELPGGGEFRTSRLPTRYMTAQRFAVLAGKVQRLRAALVAAVKPGDIRAVIAGLVSAAKGGDVQAARLLLDRCLGPAAALDLDLRLRELEQGGTDEHENETTPA